ncbi:hypothetical protein [Microbacterium enclense]|uniref:hypothetical protein n=1 Tax=Microbacterium enclense TaxID=993073 RepID=UPI003F7FA374
MSVEERLKLVFQETLELDDDVEIHTIDRESFEMWDSLAQMLLVVAIEQEFAIELTTDEVIDLESFDGAVTLVSARTAA